MEGMGMDVHKIHAGHANMFLSSIFRDTLAGVTGATIELYDTDGSVGAAKGAGYRCGHLLKIIMRHLKPLTNWM